MSSGFIAGLNAEIYQRKQNESIDLAARDFWERCVLAVAILGGGSATITAYADAVTAEWRKRFDPREKTAEPTSQEAEPWRDEYPHLNLHFHQAGCMCNDCYCLRPKQEVK